MAASLTTRESKTCRPSGKRARTGQARGSSEHHKSERATPRQHSFAHVSQRKALL